MLFHRLRLLLPCLLALAWPARAGEQSRVYALQVYDLPAPGSIEYAPFQAMLDDHPQVRYTRQSQLLLKGLERGSLLMSIAGGTAPDILRPYEHENKSWIRQGFLEKLDQYIYRDVDGDGRYTEGVDEVLWKPFLTMPPEVRELILEDGHFYLVPRFQWFQFFMYRKDIFRENGLDPDKHIETFEEFDRVCKILTDPKAKITGARTPKGRYGIGIYPNGWIWQGWLYGYGGQCMKWLKTCPSCGTESEFPQDEQRWVCPQCGASLKNVRGSERAAFNSPGGYKALKLWQDQIWAPFVKCPACREPVTLGDAHAKLAFPLAVTCAKCKRESTVAGEKDVIFGCARALIDQDTDFFTLLRNGEIAMVAYYDLLPMANTTVDSRTIGIMPFPGKGGASAFHYYGVYAGAKNRDGGADRVRVCARFILDYAGQFFVPKNDPGYLKYDKWQVRKLVEAGFYNLCSYDELMAAGLEEYAREVTPGCREMQRMIRDRQWYTLQPVTEGYSRVQQEILGNVMISDICSRRDYDIATQLRKAEEQANTQVFMKDEIVQDLMVKFRTPFVLTLLALLAFVVFLARKLLAPKVPGARPPPLRQLSFGKKTLAVVLLLPAILLIALWAYYPLARGSVMAFQDVKVMGESHWVGLENFVRVLSSPQFWAMIAATLVYVAAVLSLGFFAPVLLAIALSEIKRGTVLYRVVYYAPSLLSGAVVVFLWTMFYRSTDEGLLNHLLSLLGLGPVRWLEDPAINKWALAIPGIWAGTGSAALVYLAALKGIDDEIYEAAEIDGAGAFSKVWHVTIPSLKPLLIINLVGTFIGAFQGMGNILIMTGGAYDTNVIGLQIFTEAFAYLRFGSSTALAWILGSFLVSFTIVQLGILKKVEFRRAN